MIDWLIYCEELFYRHFSCSLYFESIVWLIWKLSFTMELLGKNYISIAESDDSSKLVFVYAELSFKNQQRVQDKMAELHVFELTWKFEIFFGIEFEWITLNCLFWLKTLIIYCIYKFAYIVKKKPFSLIQWLRWIHLIERFC